MKKLIIIMALLLAGCGSGADAWLFGGGSSHYVSVLASGDDSYSTGFWYLEYQGDGIKNASIVITYPDAYFDFDVQYAYIEVPYFITQDEIAISGGDFYGGNANRPRELVFGFTCEYCGFNFWADTDMLPGHPGFTNGASVAEAGTMLCAEFMDGQSACADFVTIGATRSIAEVVVEW